MRAAEIKSGDQETGRKHDDVVDRERRRTNLKTFDLLSDV